MKNSILLYITILSLFSANSYAQKLQTSSGDNKYNNYAYIRAISTYERVAEKGYKSEDMFQKLGNSYYFNGELDKAAKWYNELFLMNVNQTSEYCYRYAQCLKAIGQSAKANEMLEIFHQKANSDTRGKLFNKNKNYLEQIKANSGRYKIENAGINSKFSDFGSTINKNTLVFASSRNVRSASQRKHTWTNQNFTNLYEAELDQSQLPIKIKEFSKTINSKFNESTPIFTKDGKTMYFTRNNYLEGKRGKNKKQVILIKIYKATLENKRWSHVEELPFNSDRYSVAHPTLSPDEKTLYFASDMPGSIGQSDLFKVELRGDGSYGSVQNLGPAINTEGRETFPFVTDEHELYFASDGHPGLGGLDNFVTSIASDGTIGEVQNLGGDINSPKDDFAYFIDNKTRRGFVTSNRDGGKGNDDIYTFIENKKLSCSQELYGIVTTLNTGQILTDAKMSLFDSDFKLLQTTMTDSNGGYKFRVTCGATYHLIATKANYIGKEDKVFIIRGNGETMLNVALEKEVLKEPLKEVVKVEVGDDLGKILNIKIIYFDLNKADILPRAIIDLEKILDVLNQNPLIKIDVRSHTDCRQSARYNQLLSDRRAKATIAWLIMKGISPNRLSGRGYGESQLVNSCGCEPTNVSNCTEEQHQRNRRSEFIILEM